MSVVNDVLKNLDKRQAKKKMKSQAAFALAEDNRPVYFFWGMVCVSIAMVISASLLAYMWLQQPQYGQDTALPYELLLANDTQQFEAKNTAKATAGLKGREKTQVEKSSAVNQSTENKNHIVRKTSATHASEQAINAINNGDVKTAKQALPYSNPQVQDEVKLRLMIKERPHEVLGYIQKNYQYKDNPELIAMAAQGQQRSGRHRSAVVLYRKLIRMQPNNAKWRAGIAISYEVLGMAQKAKSSYTLALNMPNLPSALRQFSENRLTYLQ